MKFIKPRPFPDPDLAARKLVEIANGIEAVQDGRIFIELINDAFLKAGGTAEDFRAEIKRAITPRLAVATRERDVSEIHRQWCGADALAAPLSEASGDGAGDGGLRVVFSLLRKSP
jgi:hypothetical protein